MPQLDTARRVAADKEATWPELLCGLSYNATTKRLNVHVLRANRLKVPDSSLRTPSKFIFSCMILKVEEGIALISWKVHCN